MSTASVALLAALIATQATGSAQTSATTKISGRVTASESGAPIAGARVVLFLTPQGARAVPFARPAEAITDQDGRFAFDGLAAGSYNLDVQKTGYVAFPDANGRPHSIQLAAGQRVANVDVQLQRGAIIAGRILDATGQPLADVSVMALRRTTLGSQERYLPRSGPGQTNDIGEFRVAGLAPGDYIVAAAPRQSHFGGPGIAPPAESASRTTQVITYYPGTREEATAQIIHVSAAQTVDNVVFTILSAPAYRISGVVVDEAGSPVAGAMVMLVHDGRGGAPFMGPQGNSRSRDDGSFVVSAIPAGTYRMSASIPVTITSTGGGGGGSVTTWTSTASGGTVVTGGIVGGITTADRTMTMTRAQSMPPPTDVVVADADVSGVRVVVKR